MHFMGAKVLSDLKREIFRCPTQGVLVLPARLLATYCRLAESIPGLHQSLKIPSRFY
jgi:hypothetical protein